MFSSIVPRSLAVRAGDDLAAGSLVGSLGKAEPKPANRANAVRMDARTFMMLAPFEANDGVFDASPHLRGTRKGVTEFFCQCDSRTRAHVTYGVKHKIGKRSMVR